MVVMVVMHEIKRNKVRNVRYDFLFCSRSSNFRLERYHAVISRNRSCFWDEKEEYSSAEHEFVIYECTAQQQSICLSVVNSRVQPKTKISTKYI